MSEITDLVDPVIRAFTSQLETTMAGHATTVYLRGSVEMIAWGRINRPGVKLPFEGPPQRQAIRYAQTRSARMVKGIDAVTRDRLANVISNGIKNKRGVEGLQRDIRKVFGDMKIHRARMIARTECLPGDTLVDGAVVRAIHRRWYGGPMVEIVTGYGRQLSATPNHPMLTRRGWVAAGELTEGDDLICDGREQHSGTPGDHDIEAPPATLSQIFDAALAISIRERKRGAYPDFHGDGRETEIDILYPYRLLRIGSFTPLYEPTLKQFLSPSDMVRTPVCGCCGHLLGITNSRCFCDSADGDASFAQSGKYRTRRDTKRVRDSGDRFTAEIPGGDLIDGDVVAVAAAPGSRRDHVAAGLSNGSHYASLSQDPAYPYAMCMEGSRHPVAAQTRLIEFDRVISVRCRSFLAHVYNLTTPYGYYTIDRAFTGNTATALEQSFMDRSKDLGVTGKRWITVGDAQVTPECMANAAEAVVALDHVFSSGDVRPPVHPRCRCSLAPVMLEAS